MGNRNEYLFVQRHRGLVAGPVLEIGSKDYGNTPAYRSMFSDLPYVGVDLAQGKNVDVVADLTADAQQLAQAFSDRSFKTVLCMSVLEHCEDPFQMARNISILLAPGGLVFVSVPFCWRFHPYPNDYWRFTPEGVKLLFRGLDFDVHPGMYATSLEGEILPLDPTMGRVFLDNSKGRTRRLYGYPSFLLIRILKRMRLLRFILRHGQLFPPTLIFMVGKKAGKLEVR